MGAQKLGLFGIQRIHMLRDGMVLAGAGVGGGSLNYANTLYSPRPVLHRSAVGTHHRLGRRARIALRPGASHARRGRQPTFTNSDHVMKELAEEMGVADTFGPTPVGVFFSRGPVARASQREKSMKKKKSD